jgi:hypothetical protein
MFRDHPDLLSGWKVPSDGSIPKLACIAQSLISLVTHAPEVGHLDSPALHLSLDLSLHSLLGDNFLLKIIKRLIQIIFCRTNIHLWDTLWDLCLFHLGSIWVDPQIRWLILLG